jgi:hypothetical protein
MGIIAAFVFRHRDPPLPEKTYDWEHAPSEDAWTEEGDDTEYPQRPG